MGRVRVRAALPGVSERKRSKRKDTRFTREAGGWEGEETQSLTPLLSPHTPPQPGGGGVYNHATVQPLVEFKGKGLGMFGLKRKSSTRTGQREKERAGRGPTKQNTKNKTGGGGGGDRYKRGVEQGRGRTRAHKHAPCSATGRSPCVQGWVGEASTPVPTLPRQGKEEKKEFERAGEPHKASGAPSLSLFHRRQISRHMYSWSVETAAAAASGPGHRVLRLLLVNQKRK